MLKILLWFVSPDDRFLQSAILILKNQFNDIELVGVTASVIIRLQADGKNVPFIPLDKVDGGGV